MPHLNIPTGYIVAVSVSMTEKSCFIQEIYVPSSSLLQGKYLPFSPSPLLLNIFRLFVILSLTQLYRYTPIDFQGQRTRSQGLIFRRVDTPRFALPLFVILSFSNATFKCLFVILSLTQLYRYTPEIFLFSTATFKYTY
jgi:hypothetical protein